MSAGGGGGGADSGEDVGGEVGGASDAIDPYDLLDPVDVLGELPKDFYTRIVRFFGFCQLCASVYRCFAHCKPLDAMGISLNKQKLMYKVLTPSTITPI